jgi:RNA polymerase sigma-70 factor (ECF subfamily)
MDVALRGFLVKRVANVADREDLEQEILLRAWAGRDGVVGDERAWFWRIARNAVIDYYRRGRKLAVGVDGLEVAAPGTSLDGVVESWLGPMVEGLPETYREAVRLSELEGMGQAEVAARMGLTVSGVKSRIQRGRAKLREELLACCEFAFDGEGRISGYWKIGGRCAGKNC